MIPSREHPDAADPALGIELSHIDSPVGRRIDELVILGLRRNPRRAHLLVSTVLGKHIPIAPDRVLAAAGHLAHRCRKVLRKAGYDDDAVDVFGFAETATGLGHSVAEAIGARWYLHSTRRAVPGIAVAGEFQEGHSHATDHLLLTTVERPHPDAPLILVDDEISTGKTVLAAIEGFHAERPAPMYVIASLVDVRADDDLAAAATLAERLGVPILSASLARGRVHLPDGLIDLVASLPEPAPAPTAVAPGSIDRIDIDWPAAVPDGGRHGFLDSDRPAFSAAVDAIAQEIGGRIATARSVIVIGHEELMYLPLRVAARLAENRPTRFQTTTRSPAYVGTAPGYPLRRGFSFVAPEDDSVPRYLYNANDPDLPTSGPASPVLVLVIDEPADTDRLSADEGVVTVLRRSGADVLVVALHGADPILAARRGASSARMETI